MGGVRVAGEEAVDPENSQGGGQEAMGASSQRMGEHASTPVEMSEGVGEAEIPGRGRDEGGEGAQATVQR